MAEVIHNRYDFVVLFDVENGNPNGDPDAGNMPRVDPETGLGLVTDVCLKRKIRNYVEAAKENEPGYRIYIKENVPLEKSDKEALEYAGIEDIKDIKKKDPEADKKIKDFMCSNFFDIRTFGAVKTTFSEDDLNLLWQAIINMFENDHSAARGNMAVRELIVFKHDSELGNAPSYKLFERVHVARKDPHSPARSYSDYEVHVDTENMPQGVTCERKI